MRRRNFVLAGLAGVGVTAIGARGSRLLAQETQGIAPIAAFATDMAGGRVVVRAYPAEGRGRYWVMARAGGRDRWFNVGLRGEVADLLRDLATTGQLRSRLEPETGASLQFEIQRVAESENFRFRFRPEAGDDIEGPGTGDVPPGGGGGGTQAFGFWGALVAIVAIFALVGIWAIESGEAARMSLTMRGVGVTVEIGEAAEPPDEGGFVHEDICDTMPPMLC
ncbi:hypothetical protein [Nioella nitratireducens]|uniref:hypothetical protein n=1 Tax=Nioella nitratireducens TaxID=1287720 RepID=UPI0008FD34E2|nr:hypothetical protein [Nioella nitratireducens]